MRPWAVTLSLSYLYIYILKIIIYIIESISHIYIESCAINASHKCKKKPNLVTVAAGGARWIASRSKEQAGTKGSIAGRGDIDGETSRKWKTKSRVDQKYLK